MTDSKRIVETFLATFSRGDVDGVLDAMTDDATWWVSGSIEGRAGTYDKAKFGPLMRDAASLYVEGALRIKPVSMVAEGSRVAVEADGFATLHNGRVYRPGFHFLFEVIDGKVRRVREYMDEIHAWETFVRP
jgi:ketosteroid isomerase-like protein